MHRQGDLLFVPRTAPNPQIKSGDGPILARGEATGHTHMLESLDDASVYVDEEGRLVVHARDTVRVVHQEHAPITLDPGSYTVIRQVEYDPVDKVRQVVD